MKTVSDKLTGIRFVVDDNSLWEYVPHYEFIRWCCIATENKTFLQVGGDGNFAIIAAAHKNKTVYLGQNSDLIQITAFLNNLTSLTCTTDIPKLNNLGIIVLDDLTYLNNSAFVDLIKQHGRPYIITRSGYSLDVLTSLKYKIHKVPFHDSFVVANIKDETLQVSASQSEVSQRWDEILAVAIKNRLAEKYDEAYKLAIMALSNCNSEIYRVYQELSICAYYTEHKETGPYWIDQILKSAAPVEIKELAIKNSTWYNHKPEEILVTLQFPGKVVAYEPSSELGYESGYLIIKCVESVYIDEDEYLDVVTYQKVGLDEMETTDFDDYQVNNLPVLGYHLEGKSVVKDGHVVASVKAGDILCQYDGLAVARNENDLCCIYRVIF